MIRDILVIALLCLTDGCSRAPVSDGLGRSSAGTSAVKVAVAPPPPTSITNRFGMTFRLVTIERKPEQVASVGASGLAFPKESYYLGQTRLTEEQFSAFRKAAAERDRGKSREGKLYEFPNAWQLAYNFGVELSALDPDYEYRLPTREEWVFACMNGYDQDCPVAENIYPYKHLKPNKFGIEGFLSSDVECGNLPGLHFGAFPTYPTMPQEVGCPCARYGFGNPEGDDGFEDMVVARYVLTPRAKP